MMQNKVVLVTGATNGIGEVAARELAAMGAEVVIVSRNAKRCEESVARIRQATDNDKVSYISGDLSLMSEVRDVASQFLAKHDRLDVLLNNAGAFFNDRKVTTEGYEMTFALNHLNYFLLTHLLLDTLKKTANETGDVRVVNVSSDAHRGGSLKFDDLNKEKSFSGFGAYSDSKLMNVVFTYELARRLEGTGISTNALHPGFVQTGFGKNNNQLIATLVGAVQALFAKSPDQGAETSVYLASSPELRGVTGRYYSNKKAVKSNARSYDEASWRRLWEISEELTGIAETASLA